MLVRHVLSQLSYAPIFLTLDYFTTFIGHLSTFYPKYLKIYALTIHIAIIRSYKVPYNSCINIICHIKNENIDYSHVMWGEVNEMINSGLVEVKIILITCTKLPDHGSTVKKAPVRQMKNMPYA